MWPNQCNICRVVREYLGTNLIGTPLQIVDGFNPPEHNGRGWCWRTRGGTIISHPSAYAKRGWSNMVYHASTRHVVVGAGWLCMALNKWAEERRLARLDKVLMRRCLRLQLRIQAAV